MRETKARPAQPACEVRVARTGEDVERALAIRSAVYLIEQQCPYEEEFDGNDRTGTHMLGLIEGEPAATLRLRYFADFAKIERVAVLPRYRNTAVAKELVHGALEFLRRKGYRKVYGHVQKRLINYWSRFGFKILETNYRLVFSDHEYVLMWGELEPHPNALGMHTDPYVLLRPEGKWDEPCLLESSATRPPTNPH
ncbi:MAG: GNAT family N-acetyltransferase [Alphaproteobacteria bacterium]|nr:GNAT family N-acetyltransferase [Alphaproteobacteria bacterium]